MNSIVEFLDAKVIEKSNIFPQLGCSKDEALLLQVMARAYVSGQSDLSAAEALLNIYDAKKLDHLDHLKDIKHLLELGWITQQSFHQLSDITELQLLNSPLTLSSSFLKILQGGDFEPSLPEIKPYADHLEYLQDQFFRIELYQKLLHERQITGENSPNSSRIKNKLEIFERRIEERLESSTNPIALETFFKQKHLEKKEKIIFLALLKEEYAAAESSMREMNTLIELISFDEYERIKNRALLEDGSRLLGDIIDYDEILNPFGGISRAFFIVEDVLQDIIHPQKKKKVRKLKLDMLIKEQELFELIDPKTSLDDVVLPDETRKTLNSILRQMDKTVITRLHQWGIKDKKKGVDARILFYGPPGTGKTMTAASLAKSLKRQVLSFDCSKILSMYVGESEKNVRSIFDTYRDLTKKSKTEPILLLNEADQFLSSRLQGTASSAEQSHNQMQNIFLEQMEKFEGVLIATTNLLENIDKAFSRRFEYKIEFKNPNKEQRKQLWKMYLPVDAPYEESFSYDELSEYSLSGAQIKLVINNTAHNVATQDEPLFKKSDFIKQIEKEKSGQFDSEKKMGFLGN